MNFSKIFQAKKLTSAAIAKAADDVAAELAEAQRRLADLQQRRSESILELDDDALDALDEDIRRTRRAIERCEAAQAELVRKAEEAREREAAEALDRQLKAAEAALDRGRKLALDYVEHAAVIADICEALDKIEAQRVEAIQAARAAGRDWHRPPAERAACPDAKHFRRFTPLVALPAPDKPFSWIRKPRELPWRPYSLF